MNPDPKEIKRLLAPMRERPVSVHNFEVAEQRRRHAVDRMKRQIRSLSERQARRRRLLAYVPAAVIVSGAAALLVLRVGSGPAPEPPRPPASGLLITRSSGAVQLDSSAGVRRVRDGESLTLPFTGTFSTESDAFLAFDTPRGVKVQVAEQSRAEVAELGASGSEELHLVSGEVSCEVPKLGKRESFSVLTPAARVVVHGTRFSVRVRGANSDQPCVRVEEGAVLVHYAGKQVALNGGDSWGCAAPVSATGPERTAATPAPPARERRRPDPSAATGTLAAETRLLEAALIAERSGEFEQAAKHLRRLLKEYPGSPLADDARAVLRRVTRAR